jgi:hypothetical protein
MESFYNTIDEVPRSNMLRYESFFSIWIEGDQTLTLILYSLKFRWLMIGDTIYNTKGFRDSKMIKLVTFNKRL